MIDWPKPLTLTEMDRLARECDASNPYTGATTMEELEGLRKKMRVRQIILNVSAIVLLIADLAIFGYITPNDKLMGILIVALILLWLFVGSAWGVPVQRRYDAAFKQVLVREAASRYMEDIVYLPGEMFPRELSDSSGIMPENADVYEGNDYIQGTYKGRKLYQCDVGYTRSYKKVTRVGENSQQIASQHTLFQGTLTIVEVGENFRITDDYVEKLREFSNALQKEKPLLDQKATEDEQPWGEIRASVKDGALYLSANRGYTMEPRYRTKAEKEVPRVEKQIGFAMSLIDAAIAYGA
jgi:hypothetical protein